MNEKDVKGDNENNFDERRQRILRLLKESRQQPVYRYSRPLVAGENVGESVEQKIKNEEAQLKNKGLAQDIALKKTTLFALFGFLAIETAVIFLFAFFQAVRFGGFALEEWSFKLLVTATIVQITTMLLVAVKHLFPKNDHRLQIQR